MNAFLREGGSSDKTSAPPSRFAATSLKVKPFSPRRVGSHVPVDAHQNVHLNDSHPPLDPGRIPQSEGLHSPGVAPNRVSGE